MSDLGPRTTCVHCGSDLPDGAASCPACGENVGPVVLEGKWQLEAKIGIGGMGVVWRARDLFLDRPVAIKLLSSSLKDAPAFVTRFEREARMMARLEHPNLVPVYAVGRHEDRPFIVMKFLEGSTLREMLKKNPRPPASTVLSIARQLCAGLAFIHEKGAVHRDIKPANIFVGPDGHVTILDLGVVRSQTAEAVTQSGAVIGTAQYMSPEQILALKDVDGRADIYALGVILFQMIGGRSPFVGDSDFSIMKAHVDQQPPDLTQLDTSVTTPVAAVVHRALAKNRDDRFADARQLFEALEAAYEGVLPAAPPRRVSRPDRPVANTPSNPRTETSSSASLADDGPTRAEPGRSLSGISRLGRQRRRVATIGAGAAGVLVVVGLVVWRATSNPAAPPAAQPLAREVPPTKAVEPEKRVEPRPEPAPAPPANVAPAPNTAPSPSTHAPRQGQVRVTTTVNGSMSWAWLDVDGERKGPTPLLLTLPVGSHRIHLGRGGFQPVDRDVTVEAGRTARVQVEMHP